MLVGLLLDLQFRSRSRGEKALDDVMRWLYAATGRRGPGYPDDFMTDAIRQSTGLDLASECHRYLETADDLPVAEVLASAGLRVTRDPRTTRVTENPTAAPAPSALRQAWLAAAPPGPPRRAPPAVLARWRPTRTAGRHESKKTGAGRAPVGNQFWTTMAERAQCARLYSGSSQGVFCLSITGPPGTERSMSCSKQAMTSGSEAPVASRQAQWAERARWRPS